MRREENPKTAVAADGGDARGVHCCKSVEHDAGSSCVINIQRYHSPCGDLMLGSLGDRLCLCDWAVERHRDNVDARLRRVLKARYEEQSSAVIREAAEQLDAYFAGRLTRFDVPLLFVGTDFQKRVWHRLPEIPYGELMSYGELAAQLDMPTAVRAVANSNGANAISIIVPCHRVIGSNGTLTGYGGGLAAKQFLLTLEGVHLRDFV